MARNVVMICLGTICALVMACTHVGADDSGFYEIGDRWVYSLSLDIEEVTLTGTVTESVDGIKTETVAGVVYDVYDFGLLGSLSISADIDGLDVQGTATYTGGGSIEMETLDEIVSDLNLSMAVSAETIFGPITIDYWNHTITTYSPPGGVGVEPDEMTNGISWVLTYTEHSETMISDDGEISTESSSTTVTKTFTFVREETITIAGETFECDVIQVDDGDSIETNWYCDEVGNDVKSVYESGSSSGAYTLQSYSFTPENSGGDLMLYVIIGVAAAAIAVVAIAAFLMLRKRPRMPQTVAPVQPEQPGPPTGLG